MASFSAQHFFRKSPNLSPFVSTKGYDSQIMYKASKKLLRVFSTLSFLSKCIQ